MAVIIPPENWQRQPIVPLRLKQEHPLADGLIDYGYILPSGIPYSVFSELGNARPTLNSAASVGQATSLGMGIDLPGSPHYIALNRHISAPTQVASGIWRGRVNSLSSFGIFFTTSYDVGSNFRGHFFQYGSNGSIEGHWGDNGGTSDSNRRSAISAGSVISVSEDLSAAFVCRAATDWSLYKNGVSTGTPSYVGSASTYSPGNSWATVNFRSPSSYGNQTTTFWAYWSRALDDGEMRALHDAPFQVLHPIRRRIWVSGAAVSPPGLLLMTGVGS